MRRGRTCRATCFPTPTYRKVNPADAPILIVALTSSTLTRGQIYDAASNDAVSSSFRSSPASARSSQRRGAAGRARRAQSAARCSNTASGSRTCAPRSPPPTRTARRASSISAANGCRSTPTTRRRTRRDYRPLIVAYRNGAAVRLTDVARCRTIVAGHAQSRPGQRQAGGSGHRLQAAGRERHPDGRRRSRRRCRS